MAYKEPNFSSYDDEELDDIARHLDREAFPERWSRLLAELAHRAKSVPKVPNDGEISATSAGWVDVAPDVGVISAAPARSVYVIPRDGVISAPTTFAHKFLAAPLFLPFVVFWTVAAYTIPHHGVNGLAPPFKIAEAPVFLVCGLGMFLGCVISSVRYYLPLKRVEWVPGGLRLSNYRRRIFVPFAAIATIDQPNRHKGLQSFNRSPRFVTVRLREDTLFGRRFTFLPRYDRRWPIWREEGCVVTELRKMVKSSCRGDDDLA